jgi:asparagine synthase (glutamine-hydrolysing)
MCGIAGFYSINKITEKEQLINKISNALLHRGPDKQGYWMNEDLNLVLIHNRLSIIDLSELADQPMRSFCGNYIIAFNGEIYNHLDIRKAIEAENNGITWRSNSDTETLLTSISLWGIDKVLDRVRGMFAFSLVDLRKKELYLVRDRFGEKPLYWFWNNDTLLWASELKGLLAFDKDLFYVSGERIREYLTFGYIQAPNSIFENVSKLDAGKYLVFNIETQKIQHKTYWNVPATALKTIDHDDPVSKLGQLLTTAVDRTMLSDVPLGSFLSGGIDSSLVTSLMVSSTDKKIITFTIGFADSELDESKYAAQVAEHLGTDHHELILSYKDVTDKIPSIIDTFDEPLGDSSVIPTFLLSQFTRKNVTVALSGDGADEFFLGYNRYFNGIALWSKLKKIPQPFEHAVQTAIQYTPNNVIEKVMRFSQRRKGEKKVTDISKKISTLKQALTANDVFEYNRNIRVKWQHGFFYNDNVVSPFHSEIGIDTSNPVFVLSLYDQCYYLPDNILTKVDRSSMSCSLETRAPFLDADVVNFALSLDQEYKMKKGSGKLILKQLLAKYLPSAMIERPKKGFGLPISEWLRTSLHGWVEELILSDSVAYNYIRKDKVIAIWKDHVAAKADHSEKIWTLICLVLWLRKYQPNIKVTN